jgi:O-antigen/teichoic acid export membrane protein
LTKQNGLSRTALKNAVQLVVDQLARVIVGFLLTPIIVSQLGAAGFGVWQVLQKASMQLAMLDGRSPEVLKWVIASKQGDVDIAAKQRAFTSAVLVLACFMPLLIFAYGLLVLFFPAYSGLVQGGLIDARIAIVLLAISALLMSIAMLFEASIRGSNIAYKLLGSQAALLLLGGALSAAAVYAGYGLVGLAGVQILVSLMFIVVYIKVARKNLPWIGFSRPPRKDFFEALQRSKWYTTWAFVSTFIFTGDVIVMAAFVSASLVSSYVLTMYLMQMVTVIILTAVSSALPGLAGIVGQKQYLRASALRKESLTYCWLLATAVSAAIVVINQSFVALWVGADQYAGDDVNALIAICTVQLVFIRHDANLLNLALDVRQKTILGMVSAGFMLLLLMVLVPMFQLYGVCLALIAGRSILFFCYPRVISEFLQEELLPTFSMRRSICTAVIILICWGLSTIIATEDWYALVSWFIVITVISIAFLYAFGLTREERLMVGFRSKLLLRRR